MDLASIEAGVAVSIELALILLLLKTSSYRSLPAFFVYACWNLFSDVGLYTSRILCSQQVYFDVYTAQLILDSALMFAVLVELAWSLLRPIRATLPGRSWIALAVLIFVVGLLLWPVAGWAYPARLTSLGAFFFRLQQDFAFLRITVFLAIAACSQALSLSWRNRELQLATGLGAYSLVSLAVTVLHTHQHAGGMDYYWLDVAGSVSYVIVLGYWVYCFASKEAERQEFTPQMREFLLAAADFTRTTHLALQSRRERASRGRDTL